MEPSYKRHYLATLIIQVIEHLLLIAFFMWQSIERGPDLLLITLPVMAMVCVIQFFAWKGHRDYNRNYVHAILIARTVTMVIASIIIFTVIVAEQDGMALIFIPIWMASVYTLWATSSYKDELWMRAASGPFALDN